MVDATAQVPLHSLGAEDCVRLHQSRLAHCIWTRRSREQQECRLANLSLFLQNSRLKPRYRVSREASSCVLDAVWQRAMHQLIGLMLIAIAGSIHAGDVTEKLTELGNRPAAAG